MQFIYRRPYLKWLYFLSKIEVNQTPELSTHRIIDLLKKQGGDFIVSRGESNYARKKTKIAGKLLQLLKHLGPNGPALALFKQMAPDDEVSV